jgi:hypothetical protein
LLLQTLFDVEIIRFVLGSCCVRYAQNNTVATQNNEINVGTQKENALKNAKGMRCLFIY